MLHGFLAIFSHILSAQETHYVLKLKMIVRQDDSVMSLAAGTSNSQTAYIVLHQQVVGVGGEQL